MSLAPSTSDPAAVQTRRRAGNPHGAATCVAGPYPVGLVELPGVFWSSLRRFGLELALWHVRLAIGEARWRGELFAGFAAGDRVTGRTGYGWTPARALADLHRRTRSREDRHG
ncbi:MAG: hypothetical protein V7603_5174 [Micromonosporaceae bacterium]